MKKLIIILAMVFANMVMAQQTLIKVNAGGHSRYQTLIELSLVKPLAPSGSYKVVNIKNGSSAPVQQTSTGKIVFILPDSLPANQTASYKLLPTKATPPSGNPVQVLKDEKGIQINIKGKRLLYYNTGLTYPPKDLPDVYARSGFIHPLFTPSGKVLTDDFPKGHAHQHGIMMAWVNTMFKNQAHDFWNQHLKTGNVEHVTVESINSGPVVTTVQLKLRHYTNNGEEVLNEKWTIIVYPFTKYFLFDIYSNQLNSSSDTLYLNKYHYGGMSFRGSRQWNRDDSIHFRESWTIMTDAQSTIKTADGSRAAFVSVSGNIDNTKGGVTVFGFPTNYNYPQPIRIHPVMPYWCFAPTASGAFTINPSESYASAYRYFVHNNEPDKNRIVQLNNDLTYPVEVTVLQE